MLRTFAVVAAAAVMPAVAMADAIPRPPELERDVQFWIRVYTEINTHQGFLHDERNLAVVYTTLNFVPDSSPRARQDVVDEARDRIVAALRRLATGAPAASDEDARIRALWGEEGTPLRLLEAAHGIRFQLGQSDRFREGLVRSGAWESHIAATLDRMGLPREIAALPHVESSFNPAAYSKVGAAGLWQFMRSTGRRYLRIDSAVDDRMDPFRSTEAAAQLLAYNYRVLGTWPLALTAYNHGAAGMRRAKNTIGTDDIVQIVRRHKSRTFGFASRNFYVSFLAALEIDRNPEKYFGAIERLSPTRFHEVAMPAYVPMAKLEEVLTIDRARLRALNPALLPAVWNGQRHVPRGYKLRLPLNGGQHWTAELLAQHIPPEAQFAGQPVPQRHRVRRGETLAGIAASYGISVRALAAANGLRTKSRLRAGRYLDLPHRQPIPAATVAAVAGASVNAGDAVAASTRSEAAAFEGASVYVVRRGDAISSIAARVGVPEVELLRINGIRNPNFIYEGQRLHLFDPALPVSVSSGAPARNGPARVAALGAARTEPARVEPSGTEPVATVTVEQIVQAEEESAREAAAVAAEAPRVAQAEPVSAAQAAALGPSVGPALEATVTTDAVDYGVAKDGAITVAAAETIGHYADWLNVKAAYLRQINGMKYGRPVLIGRRLKLDFTRVSRETFEARRRDFHRSLQATYFAAHRIIGTEVYVARRGDSLWTVTKRYERLPVWLLQQYNPDVDLSEMRAGTHIVVPRVEEVAAEQTG